MTIIDTSSAPTVPARKVEQLKPDLLLTQDHHMCPGCGEPLAIRQFLETIEELGVGARANPVGGGGGGTAL
jgi:2-oxoglutarate ferredoxin oxidoreductase subunit beta